MKQANSGDAGWDRRKEPHELKEFNQLLAKENMDKTAELNAKGYEASRDESNFMGSKMSSGRSYSSFSCIVFVFVVGIVFGMMLG